MRAFVLVEGGSVWNKTAVQRHFYIANLIRHKQVQHNLKNQKQKNKRKCSVKKKKKFVLLSADRAGAGLEGGRGGVRAWWPRGQTGGCGFVLQDQQRTGLRGFSLLNKKTGSRLSQTSDFKNKTSGFLRIHQIFNGFPSFELKINSRLSV